jgi:hypothetical protein
MLRQLLHLAAQRGTIRSQELARSLGTSPELVDLALAELVRQDCLEAADAGGSNPCQRCPLRAACLHRCQPRIWTITRKGIAWGASVPLDPRPVA